MTFRLMVACCFVTLVFVSQASQATGAAPEVKHFIVDVVAIDGEEYTVKDETGGEGKIHVGSDTEKFGHVKPGDRIDAWIYPNGHAKTIMIQRSASTIQEDRQRQQQEAQRRAEAPSSADPSPR